VCDDYRALGGLKDRSFPSSSKDSSLLQEDFVALRDIRVWRRRIGQGAATDATEPSRNLQIQKMGRGKCSELSLTKEARGRFPPEMKLGSSGKPDRFTERARTAEGGSRSLSSCGFRREHKKQETNCRDTEREREDRGCSDKQTSTTKRSQTRQRSVYPSPPFPII
jgi:hypothetical protein